MSFGAVRIYSLMSLSMIFLAGCVTTQTIQPAAKDNKIVIVSAVGDNATYKLVATTIFQNSEKDYRLSGFNADRDIASAARQELQHLGYKNVTIVNVPDTSPLAQHGIYDAGWSTISLKADAAQSLQSVIASQHADYVLLFNRSGACPPVMDCDVNAVYGFGIFQRSVIGIHKSFAYAALNMDIFDAKTLARIDNEDESEFDGKHSSQLSDDANFYNNDINYLKNWVTASYRNQAIKLIEKSKMLTKNAPYQKFTF